MTLEILDTAREDLKRGYRFYENQAAGLGDYFLDSIYSDLSWNPSIEIRGLPLHVLKTVSIRHLLHY